MARYWYANPPFSNGFHKLPTMAQLSVLLGYIIQISNEIGEGGGLEDIILNIIDNFENKRHQMQKHDN